MVRIERIICPLDLSDLSERALDQATALARWYGATISALYVWPTVPLTISATHTPVTLTQLDAATRRGLEGELERFVSSARQAGVQVRTLVAGGDPTLEILRQAAEINADLLVMGTRGRAGLQRWVLGSITEGVLRRAPCPVLTIAAPAPTQGSPVDLGTILCAVDFSEASLRALEYGFSLAQEKRGRLVLLHVVAGFEERAEEALFLSPDFAGRVTQEAEARLSALVPEGADDWCTAETCVRAGSADREILRVASEKSADLIVMGAPRKGWFDVLFGSTMRAVERDAQCPVLAVPAARRQGSRRAERRDRQEERRAV